MRLLPLLTLVACGNPCTGSDGSTLCTGTLAVDLTAALPTFTIDGVGQVVPDQISISPNATCDAAAPAVWEVWGMPPDALPIEYADISKGGREVIASEPLVAGTTYLVYLGRHDGLIPDGSASGSEQWIGFFTWEDEDSFMLADGCVI